MKNCNVLALLVAGLAVLVAVPGIATEPDVVVEDRERIRAHLQEVEAELRDRDVSHLSEALKAERERNLKVLREYRKAGEFPRNTHVPWRHPVFIDRDDRACAVGHLMIESGWEEAARNISARENLAYLLEMESPEVEQWVVQSGLTAEEAAMIQPAYSPCNDCQCSSDPVCGTDGKTYLNSCVAEQCAYVEIAHEGCCEKGDELEHEVEDSFYNCAYYNDADDDVCIESSGGEDVGYGTDADAGQSGTADAGHSVVIDAGEPDAGQPDAGQPDAGQFDWDENGGGNDGTEVDDPEASCATTANGRLPAGLVLIALSLLAFIRLRRVSRA